MAQTVRAITRIELQDDLCITMGSKPCALRFEITAQFCMIENLAVENKTMLAVMAVHRLLTIADPDNGKAFMAESCTL